MDHRTYGDTKNCKGCRYWSEMIAKAEAGTVMAMCINSSSSESGNYKCGLSECDKWASGHYGAIDSPGEGEEIIALYKEETDEEEQPDEVESLDLERELDQDSRNNDLRNEIGPSTDDIYGPNS